MFKRIDAYIRPEKLNDVKKSLKAVGIVGMTFTEVRGHGRQGGIRLSNRRGSFEVDLLDRVELSAVVSEHNVDATITAIRDAAATGNQGDGLIFISPIEDVVRIRTGERGDEAMTYPNDIDSRKSAADS